MARLDPLNRTRYWCNPVFPGMSLLHADFTTHEYAPHSHDAFVVAMTEAGGSEFKSRGQTHEAQRQHLLVFNPAEPHSGRLARSARWRYRSLYLGAPALAEMQAALGIAFTPYFLSNVFGDRDLLGSFHALHRQLDTGTDPARARESLVASFGELFRRHGSHRERIPAAPRDRAILHSVIADMTERQTESLTLKALGSGGAHAVSAHRTVQTSHGPDAAYLSDAAAPEIGDRPSEGRRSRLDRGRRRRVLRPERAHHPLQARLRHHAAAVRARALPVTGRNFSQ